MRRYVLSLLLLWPLYAQAQQPVRWTLDSCLSHAQAQHLSMQSARLDIDARVYELQASRSARYPSLDLQVGENYVLGRSFDLYSNEPVTTSVFTNTYGLSTGVTLFAGGQGHARVERKRLELERARYAMESRAFQLKVSVTHAYMDALLAQEECNTMRTSVAEGRKLLERLEGMVVQGAFSPRGLREMQLQQGAREGMLLDAENASRLALLQLGQLLQLPQGEEIALELPDLSQFPSLSGSQQGGVQLPQLREAALGVDVARTQLRIHRMERYPRLQLDGSLYSAYTTSQRERIVGRDENNLPIVEPFGFAAQLKESFRSYLGLRLLVPIYAGGSRRLGVRLGEVQLAQAELAQRQAQQEVSQKVELARMQALAAQQKYEWLQQQLGRLRDNYALTQQQYLRGEMGYAQLALEEQRLLEQAQALSRAKYTYLLKRYVAHYYAY